jgi:hypothetical protein
MKKRQPRLDRTCIRRLLAAGCPVGNGEDSPLPPDLIVEVQNPDETVAYDFSGHTEFVFGLRITNQSYARLRVERVRGRPPWRDEHFTWLGDPRRDMPEKRTYKMPSGMEIACEAVLNHRLCEPEFEPRESREGMLLAWSVLTRIPAEYLHGETFPLRITLVDQYGRSHRSLIEVRVDRSATMRKVRGSRPFGEGLDAGSPQERPVFDQTIRS